MNDTPEKVPEEVVMRLMTYATTTYEQCETIVAQIRAEAERAGFEKMRSAVGTLLKASDNVAHYCRIHGATGYEKQLRVAIAAVEAAISDQSPQTKTE